MTIINLIRPSNLSSTRRVLSAWDWDLAVHSYVCVCAQCADNQHIFFLISTRLILLTHLAKLKRNSIIFFILLLLLLCCVRLCVVDVDQTNSAEKPIFLFSFRIFKMFVNMHGKQSNRINKYVQTHKRIWSLCI